MYESCRDNSKGWKASAWSVSSGGCLSLIRSKIYFVFEDSPGGTFSGVSSSATVIAVCTSHERTERRSKIENCGAHYVVENLEYVSCEVEGDRLKFSVVVWNELFPTSATLRRVSNRTSRGQARNFWRHWLTSNPFSHCSTWILSSKLKSTYFLISTLKLWKSNK